MMNPEIKQQWLTALRSGEYKQTVGVLKDTNGGLCCMGVLAAIQGATDDYLVSRPASIVFPEYRAGLDLHQMNRFAAMNDQGSTFAKIADIIEVEA